MTPFSVSIIIPCFNGSRYLPGLVRNLTGVKGEAKEIIFVDDGSTDGSAESFRELMPEAKIIRQANSGVAAARNAGAQAASGEFLQLLDADDTIRPAKLDEQAAHAENNGLDVVYSGWQMVVVEGEKTVREPIRDTPMPCEPVAALLDGWWAPPHAYLIRRSAYWEIGGSDGSLVNAQDFDLVLRLAIAGKKFGHLPGHFADYYRYVRAASLARGPRRQYWSDYDKAVEKALQLLNARKQLSTERKQAAAKKLHSVARSVYAMDRVWFRDVIKRIRELDPNFVPEGPGTYRTVASIFGLTTAEWLALVTRRFRQRPSSRPDAETTCV